MSSPDIIHGNQIDLRPLIVGDLAPIMLLLQDPAVAKWWGKYDLDRAKHDFFEPGTTSFVIEVSGQMAGAIQYYEENEPDFRHAGMDIFLHSKWQGRGLGADALHTLAQYLFQHSGHHRLVIDPAVANLRAIACYERIGFKPVGIMRQYERSAEGIWRDGLLMDLLKAELQPPPRQS